MMLMMQTFNVKSKSRLCAFCKYWHDPANTAITPQNVVGGFWQYDDQAWNVCKKNGFKKRSGMSCMQYECKV